MKSTQKIEIFERLSRRPPTISASVLYGMDGSACAAIISGIDHLSPEGRVHLAVFPPGQPSFPAQACYSEQLRNGFWTWP